MKQHSGDATYPAMVCMVGFVAVFLQACGDRPSAANPADLANDSKSATQIELTSGIHWRTNPEQAFEEARSSGRLVMLYWTAEWCPPCHDLKANVFAKPSFIEKSRLFVPVYLDGDQPHAQTWGEKFDVLGYPTLVVLNPDGTEIVRVSGGLNLAAYEDVLETALSTTQPMDALLASLDSAGYLTPTNCRRLAYHAWSYDPDYFGSRSEIGTKLLKASQLCPPEVSVDRARLQIVAAALLAPSSASEVEEGREMDAAMWQALEGVYEISQDPKLADPNALLVGSFLPDYQLLTNRFVEAKNVDFISPWLDSLARYAEDPRNTPYNRLDAISFGLMFLRGPDGQESLPEASVLEAREAVADFLSQETTGYARSAIVQNAVYALSKLGDYDAAQTLLTEEMSQSKTPFFEMSELASLLEETGQFALALDWHEKAYDNSKGGATRVQWGSIYAQACIRLRPDDRDRIVAAAVSVIGELPGADWSARTKGAIKFLETALSDWNNGGEHDAALEEIRSAMLQVCGAVDNDSDTTCKAFLAPDA